MKSIVGYLRQYAQSLNLLSFLGITLLTAVLVTLNYTFSIESHCMDIEHYGLRFLAFFGVFLFAFGAAWLIQLIAHKKTIRTTPFFWLLLLAGPAIFAGKVSFDWLTRLFTNALPFPWDQYGYMVVNWPLKCVLVLGLIVLLWNWGKFGKPVAGLNSHGFNATPYFILLLMMVPLLAFASTQADFLRTYPKVHRVDFIEPFVQSNWGYKLLYEISYGIDFLTIETFFRGFLILAFARYAGKAAILPMAAFYCAIHFGKPLLECITSYWGGLILGVVVYHTKSIWGGLIVHLGIAWLMEIGGAIGHAYLK